jgi:predicted deacylase
VIEEQNIEFAKQLGIKHIAYDWAKCCEGAAAGDTDNYAIKYGATSVTYEAGSHYEYSSIVHATNTAIRFLQVLGMLPTEQSISSSDESLIYRLPK